MKNPEDDLEVELMRLKPLPVRPQVARRIRDELTGRSATPRWLPAAWTALRHPAGFAAAVATAALAVFAVVLQRPPDAFLQVGIAEVTYATENEGVVRLADGSLVHRLRIRSVDTVLWRNPKTNASLEYSLPREEFRDIPLQYH